MRVLHKELENKKIDKDKLLEYGFKVKDNIYEYEVAILNNQFKIIIRYDDFNMSSKIMDSNTDEEYSLVDVLGASGDFVGNVREQYENRIHDMIACCTTPNIYKSEQVNMVIEYIRNKYHGEVEYLWPKVSKNAIWRHEDNQKWFGALLLVEESKLGICGNEIIEIIDVRATTEFIENNIDYEKIFPGYHMNKKHWFTMKLDGTVSIEDIFKYIDESYKIK